MKVKISKGNKKIGGVPNVSLTPGASCRGGVPCFNEGCYAKKSLMYPAVKTAWGDNLKYAKENLVGFMIEVEEYCRDMKEDLFRWHVAGDILSQDYYNFMGLVAGENPHVTFLCFTKRYDLDHRWIPDNLQTVLSTWPGMTLPKNKDLPWAWIEGDVRIPRDQHYFRCPGNCAECGHICWNKLDKDIHIVFPKH